MEYRNQTYNAAGNIDCEINHPTYGWIPFTASPNDVEQFGRDLYATITAAGGIAAYEPPATLPVVHVITKLQLKKELVARSLWATLMAALDADADAKEDFMLASEINIADPTVVSFATALGYSQTDLEDLFRAASAR